MAKWNTKTNQGWQNICELIDQLQNVRLRRTIGELPEQHRFYTVKYSIQPQLTQVTVKPVQRFSNVFKYQYLVREVRQKFTAALRRKYRHVGNNWQRRNRVVNLLQPGYPRKLKLFIGP